MISHLLTKSLLIHFYLVYLGDLLEPFGTIKTFSEDELRTDHRTDERAGKDGGYDGKGLLSKCE